MQTEYMYFGRLTCHWTCARFVIFLEFSCEKYMKVFDDATAWPSNSPVNRTHTHTHPTKPSNGSTLHTDFRWKEPIFGLSQFSSVCIHIRDVWRSFWFHLRLYTRRPMGLPHTLTAHTQQANNNKSGKVWKWNLHRETCSHSRLLEVSTNRCHRAFMLLPPVTDVDIHHKPVFYTEHWVHIHLSGFNLEFRLERFQSYDTMQYASFWHVVATAQR